MTYTRNTGECPAPAKVLDERGNVTGYANVHVRLRNGYDSKARMVVPWPAGAGRYPTRWTLVDHPADIVEWDLA